MREITVKLYKFDELSDKAKENARSWWREGSALDEWWDCTYEDANNVGIKITEFDIDRSRKIDGHFLVGAKESALKIMEEHGEMCDTFKTAKSYLKEYDKAVETAGEDGNDDLIEALAVDFLHDILEDYLVMLDKEYEYQNADEQVDDNILANDYEFTIDGKRSKE